jgi:class 3 adenylate cyclase
VNPPETRHATTSDGVSLAKIDGARFALLPGAERATFAGDQTSMVEAIRSFLGVDRPSAPPVALLRAILFTDIVGPTERATREGDWAWRDLLVEHDDRAIGAIRAELGRAVKRTGDGILAVFEGPAQAVRAAFGIADAVRELGVEIRAVHVGEIETRGDDVAGIAVHIAARIEAFAGGSEVWVSGPVKDLVAGSGLAFEERGEHELKGVAGSWHLYKVRR